MSRVLYLTYDGLMDPLGRSQIVPYLNSLQSLGHSITVISFEKQARAHLDRSLLHNGIRWIPLSYHKRPRTLATVRDIGSAAFLALVNIREYEVVHVRSYVLAPIAALVRRLAGKAFVFDIRGLWVDERIEAGLLSENSVLVKPLKRLEAYLFRKADWIVTLTKSSIQVIRGIADPGSIERICVIPTAVDTGRFRPDPVVTRKATRLFGYIGSFGTWYDSEQILRFAKCVQARGDSVVVATNTIDAPVVSELEQIGVQVQCLSHDMVPGFLGSCDATLCFVRSTPSKVASFPTKVAESLAMGLPVIASRGISDVDEVLESERVGLSLSPHDFLSCSDMYRKIDALLMDQELSQRCRRSALEHFGLQAAVSKYDGVYRDLDGTAT